MKFNFIMILFFLVVSAANASDVSKSSIDSISDGISATNDDLKINPNAQFYGKTLVRMKKEQAMHDSSIIINDGCSGLGNIQGSNIHAKTIINTAVIKDSVTVCNK